MSNKQLLVVAVTASWLASAWAEQQPVSPAQPQEPVKSETVKLEPVKSETVKLDMVQVVGQATAGVDNLITGAQLENAQVLDLNDIFSLNPEVSAGGPVALGQKIYVRNLGEDLVNVTVDGASQAGGVFHHAGRVVIEPDLLKQVEVEAGAGSATAGFGALGGAVRFVTKDPEDLLRPNEQAGATVKSSYYSNGDSFKHSATVYAANKSGSLSGLANIISADFNNREDGDGEEIVGSESDNLVGFLKAVAHISEQQKLALSYESLSQEGDILFRPEYHPNLRNPLAKTEANRQTLIANYNLNPGNGLLNLDINAYQTSVEQLRGDNGEIDGEVESQAITLQNTSIIGVNKLIYGINYRDDTATLIQTGSKLGEENGEIIGFYLQNIISLNDKLTLTTGLRYDDYSLEDINGSDISDSGVAPNLSANFAFTPELGLSAGYAEAIRGVTIRDSYVLYQGSYVNDPDLEAERAKNTELAAEYKSGPLSLALGVFQSTIENAIGYEHPYRWSNVQVNQEDIETTGYYLNAGFEKDGLSIRAHFLSADTEQNDQPVERYIQGGTATSIGDTLLVDVNYQLSPAWYLGWTGQWVASIDEETYDLIYAEAGMEFPESVSVEKEGYSTHDVYLRWSPMMDETLVVNLTVKNLFDENYINHASPADFTENRGFELISGQNDPGRDIRLSAALKF